MTGEIGKDVGHVAVIGAGIVGVATALWLRRAGAEVTLIDREGPAAGASFGNAGLLASASIVPVPVPGLLAKVPKMLMSPDQPLFLRWSYLPRLVPFLLGYLRHGRRDRVERIADALHTLLHDSPDQHLALAQGTPAARFVRPGTYLYGYTDRAAFQADAFSWEIRRRHGTAATEHDADGIAAYDPALKDRFGFGVEVASHGIITDPGAYVTALAKALEAAGGRTLRAEIHDFRLENGRARAAITDAGEIVADAFVVTAGAWSGVLAKRLGVQVPLETERGYHMEFSDPSIRLRGPVMVTAGKFVATPMEGRLRCAGVVEFGGLNAPPSQAPFTLIERAVKQVFPDLEYDSVERWMGHRPATPDSLPVIGASPAAGNIWLGYGHQHVGLTGGPKTGRWLAQMITGQPMNTDLAAFAPTRRV